MTNEESKRDCAELSELLTEAGASQQRVIEALEALLGQFSQWDNYQRLAREVGRVRREQEQVFSRTQQLRVEHTHQGSERSDGRATGEFETFDRATE